MQNRFKVILKSPVDDIRNSFKWAYMQSYHHFKTFTYVSRMAYVSGPIKLAPNKFAYIHRALLYKCLSVSLDLL